MKKRIAFLLAVVMLLSMAACAAKETPQNNTPAETPAEAGQTELADTGEMTLYYSNSTEWADPLIEEFESKTGIKVNLVQDGTSSLFARVKAEASNPQGDVIWGGVIDTYRANQDMLQPYTSSNVADLKDAAVDPNGYYTGFDMGPMVMIYNTDLISPEDAPTKWADLLDEKYKGQIATADPTASSSAFACIMSIILAYGTDNGEGYNFVEKLVENLDGKVIESSSGVYKGVADGEYLVGLTYEEAALRYIASGASIAIVYPEEGTSSSPSGCAIIKDCKNPKSAQLFIDYLSSKEVQEKLGDLNRRSVRKDVTDPDTMTPWDQINFVTLDLDWTASHTEEFNEKWRDYITGSNLSQFPPGGHFRFSGRLPGACFP